MLLRRFNKHFSEQNWFAVGLDVIVVIVGIFLGMQVQEWYEERNASKMGDSYLMNLKSNLSEDIQSHKDRIVSLDLLIEDIQVIKNVFDNGEEESTGNINLIVLLLANNPVPLETATIEDLKATGNLVLIENKNITEKLLSYYKDIERSEAGFHRTASNFSDAELGPYLMKNYQLLFNQPIFRTALSSSTLEIKSFENDLFLRNALGFREFLLEQMKNISLEAIRQASEINAAIDKELSD